MTDRHERLPVPRFSVDEREQRWQRVRRLMAREEIDVIVAPNVTGSWNNQQANVRYLTSMGGNCAPVAAVFPREGEVTGVVGPVPSPEHWLAVQDWVTDIRPTFFGMTNGIVERLHELDVGRGRIAFAGLAGLPRQPEGNVPHGMYTMVAEAFPEAEIVNAQTLLDEARFVKSEEEIEALRQGVRIVESALDVLTETAKPGVPENVVYSRVLGHMGEIGSELPTLLIWHAAWPMKSRHWFQPTQRELQIGDVITTEIEGKWLGYCGQITSQAVVGTMHDELKPMWELQQEAIRRCYDAMRPGEQLGTFIPLVAELAEGTPYVGQIILHARGLGDDAPMTIFGTEFGGQAERMRSWVIEERSTFILKPIIRTQDWTASVAWGDTIVVRADGVERLGTREPAIPEIG
jgi:Xaa-Pro aminopeptidase